MSWRKEEFKAKDVPRDTAKTIGYLFFVLRSQEVTTALRCELRRLIPKDWRMYHGALCACWREQQMCCGILHDEIFLKRNRTTDLMHRADATLRNITRSDPLSATQSSDDLD
jgi:hypothetical protein